MTSVEIFVLKNRMLFYNMFTNLIGAWVIILLSFRSISPPFYEIAEFAHHVNMICIPIGYALILIVQILYEKPIRQYVNAVLLNEFIDEDAKITAKRRLLNAPFFIALIDFCFWMTAAFIYLIIYDVFTTIELAPKRVFFQNSLVGLISTTAAFFVMELVLQKSLAPHFFPHGGLYKTPKTTRIRIRTRMIAFLFAVNLIPFFALLVIVEGTYGTGLSPSILLDHVRSSIFTNIIISISIGVFLTVLISQNLSRPLENIIAVLKSIREGYLDRKVKVTTNDEIGYAGDVINEMTKGLKERERMKHSLELAQEVQLRLLPRKPPKIDGLDIAGVSIYCDETGGDYYDYLKLKDSYGEKFAILVGDVSDHGVHSALLMTTARAFFRLRSSISGDVASIVADVNYNLTIDIEDGGQFMTLFFMTIDIKKRELCWVRAGHDPAIIYDPVSSNLEELIGPGIPLGIDENYDYQINKKNELSKGQIIILSTDGIWEARNRNGNLFGKERFYNLVRENASLSAKSMLKEILNAIKKFQTGAKLEDDITLVIVKIEELNTESDELVT